MKEIAPQELLDNGIVQELNRQFLHPLGYRLEVCSEDEAPEKQWLRVTFDADPEGHAFEDLTTETAATKAAFVAGLQARHAPVRKAALGWVIQPIGHKF